VRRLKLRAALKVKVEKHQKEEKIRITTMYKSCNWKPFTAEYVGRGSSLVLVIMELWKDCSFGFSGT
jgi:hypothetical protein